MHNSNYGWLLPSQLASLFWCAFTECNIKFPLLLISPKNRYLLKYQVFPVHRIYKNISIYNWPRKGRVFRSGISVPLLKFLYACSVFRSNVVLFLSNLVECFFFFVCSLVPLFSLWSNLHFVFHSTQKSWPHAMKNCCYQNCLNMNHHLMNNSARNLSHQLQMVIRHFVKQLHHIAQSVHPQQIK